MTSIIWQIRVSSYFLTATLIGEECSVSTDHKVFVPARPILIEKCLIYQHVHPVLELLMMDGCIQC